MSTFVKKILVSAVAAIVLATIAMPPAAQAQTAAELQAQITSLLAQIAQLQAQLGGTTSGMGISGIPAGFTFTSNLGQGSSGSAVMYLQILLNSNAATRVAASGVGSAGQETQFFGPLTAAAVSAFQNMYASSILTPLGLTSGTGFFGASSRTKANMLIASAPSPSPTPTPTPTPTPVTPGVTTPGMEGSITVKYAPTPISGEDFDADTTGQAFVGLEVKATGSDVMINRIDLNFTTRPWQNMRKIAILDGSTVLKTMDVTSSNVIEVTVGSSYTVRMEGVGVVVPKDVTKILTIQMDPILVAGESSTTLTYNVPLNGVRGTDGAALTQTAPASAALDNRTFIAETQSKATLEISANSSHPDKARNVLVSETVATENIVMNVVNVKAKTNGAVLRRLSASATAPTSTVFKLYDGSTLLKSATKSSAGAVTDDISFEDLNVSLAKDAIKTLTIKADIPAQSVVDGTETPASSSVFATVGSFKVEDATTFSVLLAAGISGSTVTTGATYTFDKAPSIALASQSITRIKPPIEASNTVWADFKIRVNVTANGGDIYVASNTSSGLLATSSVPASSSFQGDLSLISDATEQTGSGTNHWLVRNGETKYFEVSGRIQNAEAIAYYVRASLQDIKWGITDAIPTRTTQTWGLEDFKTVEVLVEAFN